jgi:ATP-dependent DNA helicase RecG
MNEQDFNIILDEGEGYFVEFKESLNRIDREIVAFANSSGGRIFLGISDKSIIKGYLLSNKHKSEIQSIAENCEPPIKIAIEKYNEIAIIHVPEGKRKPYKCSTGYYLRNGASSQKMSTDDIISVIQNEGRVKFDELFDKRFDINSEFDLNKFRNFLRKCGIPDEYPYKDVLRNLGVMAIEGNIELLNNSGILLFAVQPAKFFIQSSITCVLFKGTEKINILDRKDFTGDLISNIEESIIFLKKHLKLSYKIESLRREEILEIPETALREAIVNAVVHRDYFIKGANISVEIFDDRVEISSPGGLPKGMKQSDLGSRSVTRNPLIASLMLRANYIEQLGTGIRRIQKALMLAGLPIPVFEIDTFFTVKYYRIAIAERGVGNNSNVFYEILTENFGVNFGVNFDLKGKRLERVLQILALISNGEFSTARNFSVSFGVSTRTIENDLTFLKNNGLIIFTGPDKKGYYESTNKFKVLLNDFKNKRTT